MAKGRGGAFASRIVGEGDEAPDQLLANPLNWRTHPKEQVDALEGLLGQVGWVQRIIVNKRTGHVVDGHARVALALRRAEPSVPVVYVDLSDEEERLVLAAIDPIGGMAGTDQALLDSVLDGLQADDAGLQALLDSLKGTPAGTEGLTDPDDTPELQDKAVTELGEVWLLGRHRIICGSSTEAHTVEKVLAGVKPHLMVTDPPYGVEYDPTRTSNNKAKAGKVLNDERADWTEAWALFPGHVAYVWHASMFTDTVIASLETTGLERRSMILWAKDRFTLGRGHYHWQHEPAWYVVRKGENGHWNGDRSQSTVWNIKAREDGGHGHSTQKPVECMKRPIENNSSPGQAVYEPFSGSGTTIIAAEMTGRCCYAVELNPPYVDMAIRRWQAFTGQHATLDGDGRTFDEIAAERAPAEA